MRYSSPEPRSELSVSHTYRGNAHSGPAPPQKCSPIQRSAPRDPMGRPIPNGDMP